MSWLKTQDRSFHHFDRRGNKITRWQRNRTDRTVSNRKKMIINGIPTQRNPCISVLFGWTHFIARVKGQSNHTVALQLHIHIHIHTYTYKYKYTYTYIYIYIERERESRIGWQRPSSHANGKLALPYVSFSYSVVFQCVLIKWSLWYRDYAHRNKINISAQRTSIDHSQLCIELNENLQEYKFFRIPEDDNSPLAEDKHHKMTTIVKRVKTSKV
jgi:hypothetical protein